MLDESPTLSTKATLIVDTLRSEDETPSTCSLDMAELKYESTAEAVKACLLTCSLTLLMTSLRRVGLDLQQIGARPCLK